MKTCTSTLKKEKLEVSKVAVASDKEEGVRVGIQVKEMEVQKADQVVQAEVVAKEVAEKVLVEMEVEVTEDNIHYHCNNKSYQNSS